MVAQRAEDDGRGACPITVTGLVWIVSAKARRTTRRVPTRARSDVLAPFFSRSTIMPKDKKSFQILVASPADMADEREMLESLVQELNRQWSNTLGLVFELIRWERDTRPGIASDPQAVINEQIPQDYDVFIGMLWGRFGTPTPRAPSGTHEEFERAIRRWRHTGTSPEIMVYFKDAPLRPSAIDVAQLSRVQEFRDSLMARGVMYSAFNDASGFQSSVRAHLSSLAQKFSGRGAVAPAENADEERTDCGVATDASDFGYLDYIEKYTTRMNDMTVAMNAISDATTRIGQQMSAVAGEIKISVSTAGGETETRRLIRKSADDLNRYGEIVKDQVPLFSKSRDEAMEALSMALALYDDFRNPDSEQLSELEGGLVMMRDSAKGSHESLKGMKNSIAALPRLTTDLNRAKRFVTEELDQLLVSIDKTVITTSNIIDSIQAMAGRLSSP
jgi:hypothetical protein